MAKMAVYCGANSGFDDKYEDQARKLGKWMVQNGYDLVYGGGNHGLMGVIADAVYENGGKVYGVITEFLANHDLTSDSVTELMVTKDMDERKKAMLDLADVCLAIPGGPGTIEEITQVFSWVRLEESTNACILYNQDGYYEPLKAMYDQMVDQGFLTVNDRNKVSFVDDFAEINAAIATQSQQSYQFDPFVK